MIISQHPVGRGPTGNADTRHIPSDRHRNPAPSGAANHPKSRVIRVRSVIARGALVAASVLITAAHTGPVDMKRNLASWTELGVRFAISVPGQISNFSTKIVGGSRDGRAPNHEVNLPERRQFRTRALSS